MRQEEFRCTSEDDLKRHVLGYTGHYIYVDANRRCDDAHAGDQDDDNAEPDRVVAKSGHHGKKMGW